MSLNRIGTWVGAICGGLFAFVFVTLLAAFSLSSMLGGGPAFDVLFSLIIPLLLGTLAGLYSIRSAVRNPDKPPKTFQWHRDEKPGFPAGHCQSCGYDLTGNTSRVCPECGEPIKDA